VEEQGDHQAEIGLRSAPDQPLSAGPGFGERQVDYCFAILPKHFRVWCSLNGWGRGIQSPAVKPRCARFFASSSRYQRNALPICPAAPGEMQRHGRARVGDFFLDEADGSNFWGGLPPRQVADAEAGDSGAGLAFGCRGRQNVLPLDQADETKATSTGPCPPNAPSSPV
jgi:hypothetical protein